MLSMHSEDKDISVYEEWLKNMTDEEIKRIKDDYGKYLEQDKELTKKEILNPQTIVEIEKTIKKAIDDLYVILNKSKEYMNEKESETQDLLHDAELSSNKNVVEGHKLYKNLARIRRERRACKENIERAEIVWKVLLPHMNDKKMQELMGRLDKQIRYNNRDKEYTVKSDFGREFLGKNKLGCKDKKKEGK